MQRTVVAGLVLAACSLTAGPGEPAPNRATHTITIDATRFQPDALTIRSGDVVIWINKDVIPHTATSRPGGFDSGTIEAGASWKYAFKNKGEFAYVCVFHRTMKANLRVE